MQIRIHAPHAAGASVSIDDWARRSLQEALSRFANELSALEVHFSDDNAARVSADHKRCTLEARLHGREPLAVQHQAERLDEALQGARAKLERALERELDKRRDAQHRQRDSIRHGPDAFRA